MSDLIVSIRFMTAPAFEIDELARWIEFRFSRASGPGGQNVNKLSTRVTLLFDFEGCEILSDAQRVRIRARLNRRLSADGRLKMSASSHRTQMANRAAAQEKLLEVLDAALKQPKRRSATRPTRASKERRLSAKKERGVQKRERQVRPGRD